MAPLTSPGSWSWHPDFWVSWPVGLRWGLALVFSVAIGLGVSGGAAWAGDGGQTLGLGLGLFVGGLLAAVLSPVVVFGLWFATLFHADLRLDGWPASPGQLAGAGLLLSGLAAALAGRCQSVWRQPGVWLLLVLGLGLSWSAAHGVDPERGWILARYPILYAWVAWVLALSLRTVDDWRLLAWVVVVLTAIHGIPGMEQALERGTVEAALEGRFSYGARIQGTAANPIVFGWNMIYGLPAAVFLATVERQPLLKAVALGLGGFGLGVSLLTFNRQGFVLAAVAIGATVLLGPSRHRKVLAMGAGVATAALALLVLPVLVQRLVTTVTADSGGASGGLFRDPSFLERRDAFLTGVEVLRQHPVHGLGLGAFPYSWRNYYPRDGSTYFTQSTLEVERRYLDNGYMQVLVETGAAGFVVVAFVVGWLGWQCLVVRRRLLEQGLRDEAAVAGWVLGLGTFVLVSTLVQDTLLNPRVWILFGGACALLSMARTAQSKKVVSTV